MICKQFDRRPAKIGSGWLGDRIAAFTLGLYLKLTTSFVILRCPFETARAMRRSRVLLLLSGHDPLRRCNAAYLHCMGLLEDMCSVESRNKPSPRRWSGIAHTYECL